MGIDYTTDDRTGRGRRASSSRLPTMAEARDMAYLEGYNAGSLPYHQAVNAYAAYELRDMWDMGYRDGIGDRNGE